MESCSYFDGKSAQAHECKIHIDAENVYIYLTQQNNKTIIWNKKSIRDFQINGNQLVVKHGDYPHETIEYQGAQSVKLFDQLSGNAIIKKTQSLWYKNQTALIIGLCVFFIGLGLLTFFVFLPWIGEKSVALIPKDAEQSLGDNIAQSVLQSYTEEDSATYYANQFVNKLKTNSSYSIQITVIESDEINAFALPGGNIFVYSEIIKNMNTYEEFAALLGHEISHVNEQHSLKSICRSAASSIVIAYLFGDVTGISSGILEQANEFSNLNYSRELETDADNSGYEVMIDNRISPKGMIDLLQMLQKESHDMPEVMKYFSSHPETQARIDNIKSKATVNTKFAENTELKLLFDNMKSHLD
jgi:beta-barrel assembly-enhancing protease